MKVFEFFQSLTSVIAPRLVTMVINGDYSGGGDDDDNIEDDDDKNNGSCKFAEYRSLVVFTNTSFAALDFERSYF